LTIDIPTGNIGIGIVNPTEKLHVAGNIIADTYFDNGNTQTGSGATALGGSGNTAGPGSSSTVGGGSGNTASGSFSTIGGGAGNIASGLESTVGGGDTNKASERRATIGGGFLNKASGSLSTVGGGSFNIASETQSTVGGGFDNLASGLQSTVPGGTKNQAGGDYSFAAGRKAKINAAHPGAFVWADSTFANFFATAADQFSVRAGGGTRIFSMSDLSKGVLLLPGTNVWAAPSDYRLKDNISEYSVLDKLDDYRAVEFDWKAGGNHDVGVMAQELQSIFPELVNAGSSEGDIANAADPGVWSVQYSKLGALALQAIKEQQEQMEDYELQLESQNEVIDSQIDIICAEEPDRQICLEN